MRKIEGIKIEEPFGTYPVVPESVLLAKLFLNHKRGKVLDVGTGAGYIAIFLAKLGFNVVGSDINPTAVKVAKRNSVKNNKNVDFVESDLFDRIEGLFNFVVFHLPGLSSKKGFINKCTAVKAKITPNFIRPYIEILTNSIVDFFTIDSERELLKRFLFECPKYLKRNCRVYLRIYREDVRILQKVIGTLQSFKIDWIRKVKRYNSCYFVRLTKVYSDESCVGKSSFKK